MRWVRGYLKASLSVQTTKREEKLIAMVIKICETKRTNFLFPGLISIFLDGLLRSVTKINVLRELDSFVWLSAVLLIFFSSAFVVVRGVQDRNSLATIAFFQQQLVEV